MSHAIVDRRLNDKGKNSVNRRKFIDHAKGILKESVRDLVRNGTIKDLTTTGGKRVKIPKRSLEEPSFHHDGTGVNDLVRPGNDRFIPGDKIKRPDDGQGQGGGQGSEDGDGEDSFTFHLTKEEFLDLFFENCALPDLIKQNLAILTEEVNQRAGFTSDGSPSMMNVMRSMRNAKGRRSGLRAMKTKKLRELEAQEQALVVEIQELAGSGSDTTVSSSNLTILRSEIETLKRRIKAVPFLDPLDLKYNNWTKIQLPKTQAVMVCVMDVSGSMDQRKKELAKTFYLLLYLFLMQQYEHIEIEYVTYHTRAQVVNEQNFYYGTETGGTVTSAGLQTALELIQTKYNPSMWNVYVAHSSDGDNFSHDNVIVKDLVVNKLLPISQYYAYVQISPDVLYMSGDSDGLWNVFQPLSEQHTNLSTALITNEQDVYPVFVKLFEKK